MRTRLALAALAALALFLASCGPAVTTCTDLAAAGVAVTVFDASGARICDATVSASGAGHDETLESLPGGDCTYIGLFERPGTFTITATHPSLAAALTGTVTIAKDECHVIEQHLELRPH